MAVVKTALSDQDVVARIRPWFADRMGVDDVGIRNVIRHSEGFSWITYTLQVFWTEASRDMSRRFAVRMEPPDGVLAPYDTQFQFLVHQGVVQAIDVPMPALFGLELDASVLGMPFYVMDQVDGRVPVPDEPQQLSAGERATIGEQFVEHLARIHRTDWKQTQLADLLSDPISSDAAAGLQIQYWTKLYEESVICDVPVVRATIAWLHENIATSGHLAMCHGDYRNGNFMVNGVEIVAIFDWELVHVSDPLEDVAWASMLPFQGSSGLVAHLLPLDDFLARYELKSGIRVDPAALRFWQVLNYLKMIAIYYRGCSAFQQNRSNDLRLSCFGHRALYLLQSMTSLIDLQGATA